MLARFPEKKNHKKKKKPYTNQTNDRLKEVLDELPKEGNGWWIRHFIRKAYPKK